MVIVVSKVYCEVKYCSQEREKIYTAESGCPLQVKSRNNWAVKMIQRY